MKIALPVDEKNLTGTVSNSFARPPYYLVYDTETEQVLYIENAAAQSQGGAGIKAAQIVIDSGADTLVTPRLGENAAKVIQAAGIRIFQSVSGTVEENLKALEADELSLLAQIHAGFHGHATS